MIEKILWTQLLNQYGISTELYQTFHTFRPQDYRLKVISSLVKVTEYIFQKCIYWIDLDIMLLLMVLQLLAEWG